MNTYFYIMCIYRDANYFVLNVKYFFFIKDLVDIKSVYSNTKYFTIYIRFLVLILTTVLINLIINS